MLPWRRQPASGPTCSGCQYFTDDPHFLEREMPGWATMGSAFGAVRGGDGLCRRHDRYLGAGSSCADHRARGPVSIS